MSKGHDNNESKSEDFPPFKRQKLAMKQKDWLDSEYKSTVDKSLQEAKNNPWNDVCFAVGENETKFYGMKGLFAQHSLVFKLI